MKQSYVTVFKTDYFSNGYLPIVFLFVLVGLLVALFVWFKRDLSGEKSVSTAKMIFLVFWVSIWFVVFVLALGTLVSSGYKYRKALAEGRADVVEGPVLLIREQPASGARSWLLTPRRATFESRSGSAAQRSMGPPATNDPGDVVKIGDKLFVVNFYSLGLGYQQTAAHGGVLTNGNYVRVHYLGNTIVKVEVKQ